MTYVSKKEKVFDLPEHEEASSTSLNSSETRLKRFLSVSDRRAWTTEESQRYQHLYGLVNKSESNISKSASFKYIPFDVLLAILMAEKDAYIQELLEKNVENRASDGKANLLYKSEGFDDSDDDRDALIRKDAEVVSLKNKIAGLESELEDCRDTLTKAMHKLESMDAILSENNLLNEKLKYSEETIKCLEAKKDLLEKEMEFIRGKIDGSEKMLSRMQAGDAGDNQQFIRLSSERDVLTEQIQQLQLQLEKNKANGAELEDLRKASEVFFSKFEEVTKENEIYKKKIETMKCLEKHISDLKKQAQVLTEKYKRESQKADDQLRVINMNTKELELLKEERDRLLIRVSELTEYESQYLTLQAKLHQVELIIDENDVLNKRLDKMEMENEQLRMRMAHLKSSELQVIQEKEKVRQLQWTAVGQDEDFRKVLKNIGGLSEGFVDKNELRQLQIELDEKNEKLEKYEKQLNDIPILESEIDMLRNKLQKCIDDFKADKDLLGKLQDELEACRKRCHELEEMAPLYQAEAVLGSETTHKTPYGMAEEKEETEYSDKGVNTIKMTIKDANCQSLPPELKDKSTLIIDETVEKLERAEEQNRTLKNEVLELTSRLSKINLEDLLKQTNELKTILETKDQKIQELIMEVNSIRKELKSYETLKQNLQDEMELLKEKSVFLNQELELKDDYLKELQESLELERKGREFAKNMIKTLEEKLEEEAEKKEIGNAVMKLQKEETNFAKQEIYQYLGREIDHLRDIIYMSMKLNKELETENTLLREAKEYFEKTQNRALKNLILKLRAELTVLKTLSKPELERECKALQHQVENLLLETDNLVEEIQGLKAALNSEKDVKDFLEKEVLSLQAELTACVASGNEVFCREMSEKEAVITKLKEKLSKTEKDLENSKNESKTLQDTNEKLIENVDDLESEQKKLKNEINSLKMRESELKKTIENLQEKWTMELEKKEKECLEKTKSLEEALSSAENLQKELSERKLTSTDVLEEKIKQLEDALTVMEESLKIKEQELQEALKAKEETELHKIEESLKGKEQEMEDRLKAKEQEMEDRLKAKEKEMEDIIKAKDEELESIRKISQNTAKELNKLCSEMEVLKLRLTEKEERIEVTETQITDITSYETDLEEKHAMEEALRKIDNELEELKGKLQECSEMENEMESLRSKRDSLLEKMQGFENEIESLKKKLSDFESLKNELMQLKTEKAVSSEYLEISKLYQEVLEQKTQITNLKKENENLRGDLRKNEQLLEVQKHLQNKIPDQPGPPTIEFFTPPALLSPRTPDLQESLEDKITLDAHKKEIEDLKLIYEQKIRSLKDSNMEKLRKLAEHHEKESKVRAKSFYENLSSIKASYENDIKKLVEKHKLSFLRLQGLHEDEVQELNTTYETQMEAMQTQNENLINDLRTESAEKLKQLREQHNRDIRELTMKYETMLRGNEGVQSNGEMSDSSKEFHEVEDLPQFYKARIMELEEKHNQEMKKCKKSHLKRIELMKNKYEALLVEERKKYEQQMEEMLLQLRNGQEGVQAEQYIQKKTPKSTNPRLDFHEVLQKILNEGLECLTFEELILVHSKTCFIPEFEIENGGGGEFSSKKSGSGCKHRELMAAEKEQLLKRIFTLEHEIVIKQLETHEAIVNMEAAEMLRIQELKKALCSAQQKNAELRRLLSDQSKQEMNLKIDRYMSDKQATFHESNIVEKVKELEKEKADKKRLEEELQKEKANAKSLSAMMEAEKERHQIHRKRDAEYVESMRQRLEEALNREQMMEAQLDYETKLRHRFEAELKNYHENWKSDLPPPPLDLDIKPVRNFNNKVQNEVAKESKHGRSKSRRRSRLKSINN